MSPREVSKEITLSAGHFHALHRLGALIAREKHYFEEEGLDNVKVMATGEDELTIEGLKNGTIDFGLDVKPRLICRESHKGEKLYIIGGMINELPCSLISVKEIKTIADLKGKRIRIGKGGGRNVPWFKRLLREVGLDPDKDVTFVLAPTSSFPSLQNVTPQLDRGEYDAAGISGWYPRPQLFEQIAKAGYNHLAELSDTYPGGSPDRVLVTTGDMLEKNPQIVKGFLRGIIRGYRFAMDEKNLSEVNRLALSYQWEEDLGWHGFDPALRGSFGWVAKFLSHDGSVKGLDIVIAEEKAAGMLPKTFTEEQVARLQFQREVAEEIDAKFGPGGYEKQQLT